MAFQAFFDDIPTITLCDPLAEFLGATDDGLIEYSYADAVRLAGHSCPTVAGAWLMTTQALKRLYTDQLPERGQIAVAFRQEADEAETGVIAGVVGLITGAANTSGFKGLRGQFVRRNLMQFGQDIDTSLRFTRLDTQDSVGVSFNSRLVPASEGLFEQLFVALAPEANTEHKTLFATNWQERVRRIFEHADHPDLLLFT